MLFGYTVFVVACLAAVLSLQQFLPFVWTAALWQSTMDFVHQPGQK